MIHQEFRTLNLIHLDCNQIHIIDNRKVKEELEFLLGGLQLIHLRLKKLLKKY